VNRILCCDWLPEQARWSYLARSGLRAVSCKKNFVGLRRPFNKIFFRNLCRENIFRDSYRFPVVSVSMELENEETERVPVNENENKNKQTNKMLSSFMNLFCNKLK